MSACVKCGGGPTMPLHGDKGGPQMCPFCIGAWNAERRERDKDERHFFDALLGRDDGGPNELTLELLEDAIKLTHPDKHPPERADLAQRVTADLLALRPHVRPAPKPKPAPQSRDISTNSQTATIVYPSRGPSLRDRLLNVRDGDAAKPVTPSYPCEDCRREVPLYYCDACRARFDADQQAKRNQRREYQRRLRARKQARRSPLTCLACGQSFKPKRKDARTCSPACRQRRYRNRATTGGAA